MPATGRIRTIQRRGPDRPDAKDGPDVKAGASRRDVLRFSSLAAMAAAAGCGEPPETAVPYIAEPDGVTPGEARHYASGIMVSGIVQPVLATVREGRPITLAGNPQHPASGGAIDAFAQAAILSLYDPERETAIRREGRIVSPQSFAAFAWNARARMENGACLAFLTPASTSPTLHRQIAALKARYPDVRHYAHEPGLADAARAGPALSGAPSVISLGADPLGPGPFQVAEARTWAAARRTARQDGSATRLLVAEAVPTLTGSRADTRLPVREDRMGALAQAIAGGTPELSEAERGFVEEARALLDRGEVQLIAGSQLPASVRARIEGLGAPPRHAPLDWGAPEPLETLVRDLEAGEIDTLVCVDTNPVYSVPGDIDMAGLLGRAGTVVNASRHREETSLFAEWFVPLAHPFETWSDGQAADGTPVICQPLARARTDLWAVHELLALFSEPAPPGARDIVRATWRDRLEGAFERAWRRVVHDGLVPAQAVATARRPSPEAAREAGTSRDGLEILFRPDPAAWDGCFTRNIWLQETPKPVSLLVWRNAASIAPATAQELQVETGDLIAIEAQGRRIEAPAFVQPGQAPGTVLLTLGYGRRLGGGHDGSRGYDAYRLRSSASPWRLTADRVTGTGERADLVSTQHHHEMDGHHFVRTVAPGEALHDAIDDGPSLHPDWESGDQAWAMAIDLDLCIGCNACMTACQGENNVLTVGEEQVARGREMHWIRIDRYYEGPDENPQIHFQPVPCMHCEQAPCEMGCPVNATVHSDDGLNLQVYNRCIGTRTCQAYCPYKVRRFNFHEWTSREPDDPPARRNPEVTVRSRGVMEKCTYCVQRIQAADIAARMDDRAIGEGEVVTACQAACPTGAIIFGDKNKPRSAVARAKAEGRNYDLLAELGVRPRTSYLARVKPGEPRS
ncbi:4Fe-4S dicluster domain-containing protein [Marinicauda algicola]|uniref:4Fe-4S dicluster domain-containing protein n=1 Tax=Marinicauda algicola TaxID=2029849 RepID=A0A4S2H4N4_9PROT|nr:4Fe-4S dicluster domain-containing protein [Marinicauda algicola]TGY90617.1 4Fe-4S dicluster domain-containing protein [Marinicauda algicola]